jgi:hypothetical protein
MEVDMAYKVVQESNTDLKVFRVKIVELCLLTLTALFALLSFNKNSSLFIPAIMVTISMLLTLVSLLCGANKDVNNIEFKEDMTLISKIEMKRMSYQFTAWEYFTISIYTLAIITFMVVSMNSF